MKSLKIVFICVFAALFPANAQQTVFDEFKKKAGDYAALYANRVEEGYPSLQYINHPYWDTDEFREGTVCYNGHLYTHVKLRYDTYLKSLIVISPEKKNAIHVNMKKVDYFIMEALKFIPQENDFIALLYDSTHLRLIQQITCKHGMPVEKERISYQHFRSNVRFVLYKDNQQYAVSSLSGMCKIFPVYKKQLKAYAKENSLDFSSTSRASSLLALVQFTDSLMK